MTANRYFVGIMSIWPRLNYEIHTSLPTDGRFRLLINYAIYSLTLAPPHNHRQLLMVVHFKPHCNTYGSLAAYIVALLVRLSGGEPLLGLPAAIHYPGYDADEDRQLFPFRTMAMVLSLLTLIGVSWWTKWAFETGRLAPHQDYFRCVVNIPEDAIRVEEPAENGEQVCVCGSIVTLGSTYY